MTDTATVYVVDDDEAAASSVEALMISHGIDVEVFGSAESFLETFDARHPACLVLDIRLPGMSGLDLQENLAAKGIRIPIIMISGHADQEAVAKAKRNGAVRVLEKPFSGGELFRQVEATINRLASRNHY